MTNGTTVLGGSALHGLGGWLADNAQLPLPQLHAGFCDSLVARGLPIWRSSLGLELLHPEQSGVSSTWIIHEDVTLSDAPRGVELTNDYLASPVRIIDDTNEPFRRKLDGAITDLPLLEGIREQGGTDYTIFPFPFLDRDRSAFLSFVTRRTGGFTDSEFAALEAASRLISPYAERRVLRRMAIDLLDTYVGHYAGERIYSGQIRRGAVDTIKAAILICDMRDFTAMSNRHDLPEVIETLNAWFGCIEEAVDGQKGEILKFMGDGLLAIFRADPDAADACRRALAATVAARDAVAAFNLKQDAETPDAPTIAFGMGLHVGDVAYGNVGGSHRLDFTVLGPAVNYASRLQDLAKHLEEPILTSQAFAECAPADLVDLGVHALRSIGETERVFAVRTI